MSKVNHHPQPVQYVPALTGLRAVAAYLVFLHHYNPAVAGSFAHRLFAQGYMGVSVFFILSGFLIYYRYADDYFAGINWSWRRYLQSRFARTFPLYAGILCLTGSANAVMGKPMSWSTLVLNLTLVKGFFDEYKFSGIAQSWSLTVEACFYGAAPLLFVLLRRWGALPLTIGLTGVGLLLWITVGQLAWHGFFGTLPFMMFYTFFGRAFEFVVGMWLARYGHQNQLPQVRHATFFGLLLIAGCVLWQASVPLLITSPGRLFWSEVAIYSYVLPVGIGVFFLGLIRQQSGIQQFLSQPIIQTVGRSSYAFYLIHIGVVANGLRKLGITNQWLLFGLLLLIAHGLYRFVERPLHRWFRPGLRRTRF